MPTQMGTLVRTTEDVAMTIFFAQAVPPNRVRLKNRINNRKRLGLSIFMLSLLRRTELTVLLMSSVLCFQPVHDVCQHRSPIDICKVMIAVLDRTKLRDGADLFIKQLSMLEWNRFIRSPLHNQNRLFSDS